MSRTVPVAMKSSLRDREHPRQQRIAGKDKRTSICRQSAYMCSKTVGDRLTGASL
jgi:hypothetical protein